MWSEEKIWDWYGKNPWIVGFNYLPSNAVNSTEMWQKESYDITLIEKELCAASRIGYNACRVFIQYLLWKEKKEELYSNFEMFLDIAGRYGIKVMPVLFDDCAFANKEPYLGKQDEPIKGIHNSGWTPSPGFAAADDIRNRFLLEEYVTETLNRFGKDERILVWDLYNEPGNSGRKEKCLDLLHDIFRWARSSQIQQPLTSGVWAFEEYDMVCAELSDIISFHDYRELEESRKRAERLEVYGRPLLCTEWLHRNADNRVETHMPYYKEKKIGIFNWGLVEGKSQTYLSWDASENTVDGEPEIWQHDILRKNLTPYNTQETDLISSLIKEKKVLHVPIQDMTRERMEFLEKRGLIIRLYPSHHRFEVEEGCGEARELYTSSETAGAHKLLAAGINRTSFDAFGMHDENEDIFLLGGEKEKELYMLIGLYSWEILSMKKDREVLCSDDFLCFRCKYNDPFVSFFTMCKGVLHGEAAAEGDGETATFYVTEPAGIKLTVFPLENMVCVKK